MYRPSFSGFAPTLAMSVVLNGCAAEYSVQGFREPAPHQAHANIVIDTEAKNATAEHFEQTLEIDGNGMVLSDQRATASQDIHGERVVRVPPGDRHVRLDGRYYQIVKYDKSTIEITRAHCPVANGYRLDEGHTYLFEYSFRGTYQCSMSCTDITNNSRAASCDVPREEVVRRPATVTRDAAAPMERQRPLAPYGVAAIVAGGIGATFGAAMGIVALVQKEEVIDRCGSPVACGPESTARATDANRAAEAASTALGIGGGLVLGGVAVLLFGPTREVPKPVLSVDKNGASVGVLGTF